MPEEREGAANKGSEGVNRTGTRIVEVTAPPLVLLEAENPLFPVFSNESGNVLERLLYTLIRNSVVKELVRVEPVVFKDAINIFMCDTNGILRAAFSTLLTLKVRNFEIRHKFLKQ